MRLSQKIALHTGIQTGGKIISLVIGLFSVGLMSRFLGTDGYGEYNTVITFLSFFSITADLGLYLLLTREISQSPEQQEKIAGNIFTLRVASSFIIVFLAPIVAFFFPYSIQMKSAILWGVFAFIFASLTQVLVGVFQKEFKTQITALGEIVSRAVFLAFIAGLFFYFKKDNLILLIIGLTVSNFANFFILFIQSQKIIKIRLRFDKKYWYHAMKESLPMAAAIVFNLIYFRIDTIMLSVMKSSHDVGIYGVAYKILEILIVFPSMFIGVMLPLFSKSIKADLEKFKSLAQQSLNFMIISALPIVVGGYFLAKPIILLISGSEFVDAARPLRILIIATGIIFIGTLFGHLIVSVGAQRKMVKVYLLGAVLNVILNTVLIRSHSYIGASVATLLTEFAVAALSIVIFHKAIRYLPSFKLLGKAIMAAGIMGIVLFFTNDISIFILLPLGTLVYFGVLYFLRGLPKEVFGILKS